VRLSLSSDEILRIDLEGQPARGWVDIPADTTVLQRVYVTARPQDPAASVDTTDLTFWVEDVAGGTRASKATTFNGRDQ